MRNYYKVKGFCDLHKKCFTDVEWDRVKRLLGKSRTVANDRAPRVEEIKRLMEYPDRRIKPIVLVMLSSAMRVDGWNYLQWKHITPLDKDGQPVKDEPVANAVAAAKLIVYAGEPEQYLTFITPQAYNSVREWMDYRAANGEKIGPESWVMRDIWVFKYRSGAGTPEKLSASAVKKLLNVALWVQGLRFPLNDSRRHEFKAAHGFRRWFKTQAEDKMHSYNVFKLMDHKTGIADHYARPTEQKLLEEYLLAVNDLTIFKEPNISQKKESLEAKVQSSNRVIKDLEEQLRAREDDIKSIREDMKNIKTKIDSFLPIVFMLTPEQK